MGPGALGVADADHVNQFFAQVTLQAARRKDADEQGMLRHAVQRPRQKLRADREADELAVLGAALRREDVGFGFCIHGRCVQACVCTA